MISLPLAVWIVRLILLYLLIGLCFAVASPRAERDGSIRSRATAPWDFDCL